MLLPSGNIRDLDSGDVEAAESRDLNVRLAQANQGGQWLRRRQAVEITTRSGFDFSRNLSWVVAARSYCQAPFLFVLEVCR